jgi:hypothetical protein
MRISRGCEEGVTPRPTAPLASTDVRTKSRREIDIWKAVEDEQ